jgi:hypothetical protein
LLSEIWIGLFGSVASLVTATPATLSSASVSESDRRRIGLSALMSLVVIEIFALALTTPIVLRPEFPVDALPALLVLPPAEPAPPAAVACGVKRMLTCTARSGNTSNSRVPAPS